MEFEDLEIVLNLCVYIFSYYSVYRNYGMCKSSLWVILGFVLIINNVNYIKFGYFIIYE